MKYIIMCGGKYEKWETPRQLAVINGEILVERTIRLLRENGVEDINISSNDTAFERFGVPVLYHQNEYVTDGYKMLRGNWYDAFYITYDPVCYIFGDVYFSPEAIKTIVETETTRIQFFASAPPFAKEYPKKWAEPFALKVWNTDHFKDALHSLKHFDRMGMFTRRPIMWELWNVITGHDLNTIDYGSYVVINDYTCDIDDPSEVKGE